MPRTEKRNFLALPVRVSGIDAQGNSFRQVVCTLDFSAKGVRISSLETLTIRTGQELVLEHHKDRVRFEVVWIGEPGTSRAGQIGLRNLEPEKRIAPVEDQINGGSYIDTWQPKIADDKEDRRSVQRFDCDRGVQYWTDQSASPIAGRLDNISLRLLRRYEVSSATVHACSVDPLPLWNEDPCPRRGARFRRGTWHGNHVHDS